MAKYFCRYASARVSLTVNGERKLYVANRGVLEVEEQEAIDQIEARLKAGGFNGFLQSIDNLQRVADQTHGPQIKVGGLHAEDMASMLDIEDQIRGEEAKKSEGMKFQSGGKTSS